LTAGDGDRAFHHYVLRNIDSLLQVVHELEGLTKLEDLVPREILWDRPPGLPSGAELLWLVHLSDRHVFGPAISDMESLEIRFERPDYAGLLAAYPCTAESLEQLVADVIASRRALVATLDSVISVPERSGQASTMIDTIAAHDRQVLSAFTERLYESGLGA
jgi:hypothetical protein